MTIDTTGRAHKPAGSPASTGGQFAEQATPGAAATLEQGPLTAPIAASSTRIATIREHQRRVETLVREQQAAGLHETLVAIDADEFELTGDDQGRVWSASEQSAGDDAALQRTLDSLGIDLAFAQRASGGVNDFGCHVITRGRLKQMAGNAAIGDQAARADTHVSEMVQLRNHAGEKASQAAYASLVHRISAEQPDAAYLDVEATLSHEGVGYQLTAALDTNEAIIDWEPSHDLLYGTEGRPGITSHLATIAVDDITHDGFAADRIELE